MSSFNTEQANPFARLPAAARGDLDAQRSIARLAIESARNGYSIASIVGVIFARLAYANSARVEDAGLLLSALGMADDLSDGGELLDEIHGEALAVLALLADQGETLADDALPGFMDETTPEAAAISKQVRGWMTSAGIGEV